MSNSKLDRGQKIERKEMMQTLTDCGGYILASGYVGRTVVICPVFEGSRMVTVSVSNMSPDEEKFRSKVGEYWALSNWLDGRSIQLPADLDFCDSLYMV